MTKEEKKEYFKNYYQKNKEKINERNKKWREANKEKFYKIVYDYRKRIAKELKDEGIPYNWLSKNERERKIAERNTRIN